MMKKTKKSKGLEIIPIKNPVAKFAHQFNKATVFKDKTQYQRNAKHKGKEPFPIRFMAVLEKALGYPINQYTEYDYRYRRVNGLVFSRDGQ